MSVVSCTYAIGNRNAMAIPGLDTEFDVPYNIVVDSVNDNAATIYASGLLPARFTPFPDNVFATCRRVSIHNERNAPLIWRAVAHYSSAPLSKDEEEKGAVANPCNRRAIVKWGSIAYQTPAVFDVNGKKIINSAGDEPDQVVEKTDYYWGCTVTKNVLQIPYWGVDYLGKTNSDEFMVDGTTVQAECARLVNMTLSDVMKEGSFVYRVLEMQFEIRARRTVTNQGVWPIPDAAKLPGQNIAYPVTYLAADYSPPPFWIELPDMGLHERLNYPAGEKTRIMTDDTPPRYVAQAVPLDGLGVKQDAPSLTNARIMAYQLYETRDFSLLPLT